MLFVVFCYYGSCCMNTFMLIILIMLIHLKICSLACDYYSNYTRIFIDLVTHCLSYEILQQIFELRFTVIPFRLWANLLKADLKIICKVLLSSALY